MIRLAHISYWEVFDIKSERAGKNINVLSGEMSYKAFEPAPLPPIPPIKIDDEMAVLLSKAHRLIGRLDGISEQIQNINLFVTMYVRKEALLSSQIEGTQATLDDILDPDIEENTNLDVADVVNYIKAMQYTLIKLEELPLCNRLLRETHVVLMEGVRGQEKTPGEFRRSQNWIGPQGGNLKNAVFVPPNIESMEKAMSDLEKFMNADDGIDPLIKAGLIHYQFETIHPFLDGNGRIGRMLITQWMIVQQLLKYPVLYISYFLKRNRIEYYDRLMGVRIKGHFEEWIRFFLNAVIDSASDACNTINELTKLHEVNYARIEALSGKKDTLFKLLNYIENNPIIDISKTSHALKLQYNTVAKAVEKFVVLGMMRETTSFKRNRRFSYIEYLNFLRKGTQL